MEFTFEASTKKAAFITKCFIIWNIGFVIVLAFLNGSIADSARVTVIIRGIFYAIAGFVLYRLVRQTAQGKRSSWLRVSIISTVAPLGIAAFIALTAHVPMWFEVAQIGSGVMLLGIATAVLRKSVRQHFHAITHKT